MIKVTKDDLQRRSARELASLFNLVQQRVGRPVSPAEKSAALAGLAMIRAEQQRRGFDP